MIAAAVMGVGAVVLAIWPTTPVVVIVGFAVLGLGNGIGYAICAQLVVTWSPANETGAATGLNSVVRTIGSAAAAPVVTRAAGRGRRLGRRPGARVLARLLGRRRCERRRRRCRDGARVQGASRRLNHIGEPPGLEVRRFRPR